MDNNYLPKIFKIRCITPIIKPSKNPHILSNYRQISLFGYTGKIYEKIISIRLTKYVIDNNLINRYTMGFLEGKSAIDALTILTHDVYNGFDRQVPTYTVFFDIKSCYDMVQYDILINRLKKYYGIHGRIVSIISDLFKDCWTRTVVNNVGSDWLLTVAGLGQGRPASPILNLLYIDPMHCIINRPQIFRMIIFADDIILYTILNYNYSEIIHRWLQQEIDSLTNWINTQKMSFSSTKTKYKIFYNKYIQKKILMYNIHQFYKYMMNH